MKADHPAQGGISLGKDRNYSHSMKFTRDPIIVNYFKWKMLDTPLVGKRHQETKGKKHNKPGRDRNFSAGLFEEVWKFPLSFPSARKGGGQIEGPVPNSSAVLLNLTVSLLSLHTISCLRQRSQPRLSLVLVTSFKTLLPLPSPI